MISDCLRSVHIWLQHFVVQTLFRGEGSISRVYALPRNVPMEYRLEPVKTQITGFRRRPRIQGPESVSLNNILHCWQV